MQDILGGNRLAPDAAFGKGHVFGDRLVQMMTDHQHVQMLVHRVDRKRPRRIGRGWQHIRQPADLDDIRGMTAARAFGMKGVDRAPLQRPHGMLHEPAFVQRVRMNHHLNVHGIRHRKAAVDSRRCGAPILMQFQRAGPGQDLLLQRRGARGIALARKGQVHRKGIGRLQHPPDMPRPRRAGGGQRAMRGAGATAQHGGHAGMQRILHLLRADIVDMAVKPARRQDAPFARDHLRPRADDDRDTGLRIRVARLADGMDAPVPQADIGLVDTRPVHDQRIGDDRIHRPACARHLRLPHPVADHLAAAELDLLAIDGQVTLDLDDQIGIGQPQPVARGRAIHRGIVGAGDLDGHRNDPSMNGLRGGA